jgi:hypothetical protein
MGSFELRRFVCDDLDVEGWAHKKAPRGLALSEEDLERVGRSKEGDACALRELLVTRYTLLEEQLRSQVPPSHWEMLERFDWLDALHAVASEAIDGEELVSEESLNRWLQTVADRTLRLHYADVIEAKLPGEPWAFGRHETPDAMLSELSRRSGVGERDARARELGGDVGPCIDELTEQERVLVQVRDYVGASWEVIADTLGYRTPQHARASHSRVLNKLVELMKQRRAV